MGLAKAAVWQAPFAVTFAIGPNAALLTLPDVALHIARFACELVAVEEAHGVLATDGSAVTLDIKKATGTTAPASGATMLATTFDLKATTNTVVSKTASNGGLVVNTTDPTLRQLAVGDRLCLDFAGTMTALAGVCVTVWLKPLTRPSW